MKYNPEVLYKEAIEVIEEENKISISLLQRKLRVGYATASEVMDMLEKNKVVGECRGAKPRLILNKE